MSKKQEREEIDKAEKLERGTLALLHRQKKGGKHGRKKERQDITQIAIKFKEYSLS